MTISLMNNICICNYINLRLNFFSSLLTTALNIYYNPSHYQILHKGHKNYSRSVSCDITLKQLLEINFRQKSLSLE